MLGQSVTLAEVLDSKERRAARQAELIDKYSRPLISFTVVAPGSVKLNENTVRLFSEGVKALEKELENRNYRVLFSEKGEYKTGNEALYCVDAPFEELKRMTVTIEDGHRFGRLFDIDVINTDWLPVSRSELGLCERGCLVCGGPAHACARSRAHPVDELLSVIERMMKDE